MAASVSATAALCILQISRLGSAAKRDPAFDIRLQRGRGKVSRQGDLFGALSSAETLRLASDLRVCLLLAMLFGRKWYVGHDPDGFGKFDF